MLSHRLNLGQGRAIMPAAADIQVEPPGTNPFARRGGMLKGVFGKVSQSKILSVMAENVAQCHA